MNDDVPVLFAQTATAGRNGVWHVVKLGTEHYSRVTFSECGHKLVGEPVESLRSSARICKNCQWWRKKGSR